MEVKGLLSEEPVAKSKHPAKLKAQSKAKYTLKSKYSKQPKAGRTHAWGDLKSYASILKRYPMGRRKRSPNGSRARV